MGLHTPVAWLSIIQRFPAKFNDWRCRDHCELCDGSIEAISILDAVDIEEVYSYIASWYHSAHSHVRSLRWSNALFGEKERSIIGRLVLRCEVSSTEAVQWLHWSDFNNVNTADFCKYPQFFLDVVIVTKVGEGHGYYSWERDNLN